MKSPYDSARVIWFSSSEASPKFYDSDDWQLTKTELSYESSKYQIDIYRYHLDRIVMDLNEGKSIRHLVSEPGVCSTSISPALATGILDYFNFFLFYFVSFPFSLFSPPSNLTKIRLVYVVHRIIPSILSKLLLSLSILSLFLYAL